MWLLNSFVDLLAFAKSKNRLEAQPKHPWFVLRSHAKTLCMLPSQTAFNLRFGTNSRQHNELINNYPEACIISRVRTCFKDPSPQILRLPLNVSCYRISTHFDMMGPMVCTQTKPQQWYIDWSNEHHEPTIKDSCLAPTSVASPTQLLLLSKVCSFEAPKSQKRLNWLISISFIEIRYQKAYFICKMSF